MPSVAKAYTVAAIEPTLGGMVSLLTPTAVTALPASLTNVIPANANVLGMRLLIRVWGHTTAGTITLTGTAPQTGGVQTETTTSMTVPETPGEFAEYTTTNLFQSINASGVALSSGLANGTIVIYGIYGAKSRVLLGETKFQDKLAEHSPQLQRGIYARDYSLIRLGHDPDWDFQGPLYCDNNVWMLQGAYSNNLTFTTIPAAPVSVLASTPVTSISNTTTFVTQPTAPGMIIQIVLGGTAPATAASVTVTGTNQYGETVSEVVIPSTKIQATYYSQTTFQSVTQISWGAFGAGATIVVNAVFGYAAAASNQDTDVVASFVLENYDSVASVTAPYCVMDEWILEGGLEKEAKVQVKGPCQHIALVGDVTSTTSQITAYSQPVDEALSGWQSLIFFDPASGAFGGTQQVDVESWKVTKKGLWRKPIHKSTFNPPGREWSVVERGYHEIDVEFVLYMSSATYQTEYLNFQRRKRRYIRIQMRGPVLGTAAGTTYYQGFILDLPVMWLSDAHRDFSHGKEAVTLTVKGKAFFDPAQGFDHKFTWYTRLPGW